MTVPILTKFPDELAERLAEAVPKGTRSRFICDAVAEKLARARDARGTKGASYGRSPTQPPPKAPRPQTDDDVPTFFKEGK